MEKKLKEKEIILIIDSILQKLHS